MTYAEKLVADLWRANTETHEKRVAIISAALKKQRARCAAKAFETYKEAPEVWSWIRDAILNADVEVKE